MISDDDVFSASFLTPTIRSPVTPASPPVDFCVTRLQKSVSDPTDLQSISRKNSAVENLDRCLSLLSVLGNKVEKVTGLVRKMPGTCRKCHGPTGSAHAGSRWGFEQCTLPHSLDCIGGIIEVPGEREACPGDFVPKSSESGNETEVSQQNPSDLDDDSEEDVDDIVKDPDYLPPIMDSSKTPRAVQSTSLHGAGAVLPGAGSLLLDGVNFDLQQTPGAAQTPGVGKTPVDCSQTLMLQNFLQQQQALQLQQQQAHQAMLLENQIIVNEMRAAVDEAKKAARSAASVRKKTSSVTFSDSVLSEAEALKASNTKKATAKPRNLGFDMNDIRKTPGMRDTVESIMNQDVYVHASLARAPNAVPDVNSGRMDSQTAAVIAALQAEITETNISMIALKKQILPHSSKTQRREARKAAAEKEAAAAKAELKAASDKLAAAKTAAKQARKAARTLGVVDVSSSSSSGSETDDELDLDETITKKKKLKKQVASLVTDLADSDDDGDDSPHIVTDSRGRAFKVVAGKLQELQTYVKNPLNGELVRTTPLAASGQEVSSSDSSAQKKKDKKAKQKERRKAGKSTPTPMPGIIPLVAGSRHLPPVPKPTDNKGKGQEIKQTLSVVDWAKMCPIKYAPTCNSKNVNLPVFIWAKLAELRALHAGALEPQLNPGELDARLRHLQCVLELVGTNSTLAEYAGYGWQLGRDYDQKVQATMDSGASDWVAFNSMFSLGPHPSFVLSAKDEVEKVVKKPPGKPPGKPEVDQANTRKKVCPRFNKCKTAKRCDWEVENPNFGRCKRLHQCSYCHETNNKSVFHQAWDCPAGGKEAVAAGTHSL